MLAWRVCRLAAPREALELEELPEPTAVGDRVIVQTSAVGVNFADLLICRGKYQERPSLPFTLGQEASGVVVAAGPEHRSLVGRRVALMTKLPDGGYAEKICVPAGNLWPIPDSIDHEAAAVLPVAYLTAHFAIHHRGRVKSGEAVLVTGASGAVGSAAIQLAVATGAQVLAVGHGAQKLAHCTALGADVVLDYEDEQLVERIKDATGGRGVDVLVDCAGGSLLGSLRRCVAFEGRLVIVGFASGEIPALPANHLLVKNYSAVGLYLGAYQERRPDLIADVFDDLFRLHRDGAVRPLISHRFPLRSLPAALEQLEQRTLWGHAVITVSTEGIG